MHSNMILLLLLLLLLLLPLMMIIIIINVYQYGACLYILKGSQIPLCGFQVKVTRNATDEDVALYSFDAL
jgi:hypothetical protein